MEQKKSPIKIWKVIVYYRHYRVGYNAQGQVKESHYYLSEKWAENKYMELRRKFKASGSLSEYYVTLCANLIEDTEEEGFVEQIGVEIAWKDEPACKEAEKGDTELGKQVSIDCDMDAQLPMIEMMEREGYILVGSETIQITSAPYLRLTFGPNPPVSDEGEAISREAVAEAANRIVFLYEREADMGPDDTSSEIAYENCWYIVMKLLDPEHDRSDTPRKV